MIVRRWLCRVYFICVVAAAAFFRSCGCTSAGRATENTHNFTVIIVYFLCLFRGVPFRFETHNGGLTYVASVCFREIRSSRFLINGMRAVDGSNYLAKCPEHLDILCVLDFSTNHTLRNGNLSFAISNMQYLNSGSHVLMHCMSLIPCVTIPANSLAVIPTLHLLRAWIDRDDDRHECRVSTRLAHNNLSIFRIFGSEWDGAANHMRWSWPSTDQTVRSFFSRTQNFHANGRYAHAAYQSFHYELKIHPTVSYRSIEYIFKSTCATRVSRVIMPTKHRISSTHSMWPSHMNKSTWTKYINDSKKLCMEYAVWTLNHELIKWPLSQSMKLIETTLLDNEFIIELAW